MSTSFLQSILSRFNISTNFGQNTNPALGADAKSSANSQSDSQQVPSFFIPNPIPGITPTKPTPAPVDPNKPVWLIDGMPLPFEPTKAPKFITYQGRLFQLQPKPTKSGAGDILYKSVIPAGSGKNYVHIYVKPGPTLPQKTFTGNYLNQKEVEKGSPLPPGYQVIPGSEHQITSTISKPIYSGNTIIDYGYETVYKTMVCIGIPECKTVYKQINGFTTKLTSPLVFDLNGNGNTNTESSTRMFDIDGDGKLDKVNNYQSGDGELAFDADGDGIVGENGTEVFGEHTNGKNYQNGFEALKDMARKTLGNKAIADGKLDANEIKALENKMRLSMKVNGQTKTLTELGITSINLNYGEGTRKLDPNGNFQGETSAFTRVVNGKSQNGLITDVYLERK